MRLIEAVRLALRTIMAQKLKSFFSLIGVLIGVTFLIAVVSIVQGMNQYMTERFANNLIGLNTFQLSHRPTIATGNVPDDVWLEWRRRPRITYADADYIQDHLRTPATVARFCSDREILSVGSKRARDIELIGTEPAYFLVKNYEVEHGRLFSEQELKTGTPVMVLGNLVAEKFFAGTDAIGKEVKVGGIPYRVIGVVAKQGTLFGLSLDKFVIVPYSTPARRLICPIGMVDWVSVKSANPTLMLTAMGEVEAIMRGRHHLRPGQASNFALTTADGALEGWKKISRILILLLPGLVAVSLVVGGIVIMNIMLMAVSERTREIGIRKALGARRRDIVWQFVVESATLATVGAVLGIGLGFALAYAVKALTPLPAAVAPWSIPLAVFTGMGVGMLAGIYPASRAARLDPIVALRAE